ncbi:MAG: hypothetical protein CMN32_07685 [Saprospirales bacterium]|nr:hypothetical protein [Saprospirales bacterium]
MVVKLKIIVAILLAIPFSGCTQFHAQSNHRATKPTADQVVKPGAWNTEAYLPFLEGKKVALMVNHSSLIGETHLVDSLLSQGVQIVRIFAPEHGFRGDAADGEHIADGRDPRSGLPVISLYGKKKKPGKEELEDIDVVVFDIQDVGARFYTFTSALSYLMEACAEFKLPVMVLDRPNPLGFYIDGPVLEPEFQSYVGLHPVPVVYGMTIGEWASMVNGEGWLRDGIKCSLTVIECRNYDHNTRYELPVPPSPNLPNMRAIYLYPSLCFFEGTQISVGRGTDIPFQCFGAPDLEYGDFYFTPQPNAGSKYPPHRDEKCRGVDLSKMPLDSLRSQNRLNLSFLLTAYEHYSDKPSFFLKTGYFEKLAGTAELRKQLQAGMTESAIRASWKPGIDSFKQIRKKYLLYPDFE